MGEETPPTSLKGRTCLVTGGAGFIGHHLVRRLLDEGASVRVLDDLSTGERGRLEDPRSAAERSGDPGAEPGSFEFLEGSVGDPAACREACQGVSLIFHQAALPAVQRSVADPGPVHEVNATGTLNLLLAAKKAGVQRVLYAGSSSAYGDTVELPKREDMNSRPLSPYAASKLAGEHYVQVAWHVYGLEGVVLRYFNVFGPGQDPASQYAAAIPRFITLALSGRPPTIHGDGEQTRDFTYVDNVVRANFLAAAAPSDRVAGRVFNVGCGERISVNRLWEEIRDLTGASVEAVHGPPRPGDIRDSLADLAAIRDAMGYRPEVDLREGLRRTVDALIGNSA